MTGERATCVPGSWLAVSGPGCWALLELTSEDPRTAAALTAVEREDPIDELLDVMISQGLRRLPGFAILGWHHGQLRYVVRPPALVDAASPGRTERIDEVTSGSWRDGRLDGVPTQVTLSAPAAALGDGEVPLAGGGVAAGRVRIVLEPADAAEAAEPGGSEVDVLDYTVDRSPLSARLEATPPGPRQPPPVGPLVTPSAAPPPPAPPPPPSAPPPLSAPPPPLSAPPLSAPPPSAPPGLIDGVPWAFPPSGEPPMPPPSRWAPPVAQQPPPPPPPPGPPTGPPTGPPPRPPPGPPPAADDGPTGTRKRADLLRELAHHPPAPTGPTVWAVVCPNGHLTPSYAAICRVCASPLPEEQTPVEVARPALGRLVLSTGGSVVLDRDSIFGRAPSSPVTDPAQRPNLVKLADTGEVSRRHAEVRIEGWVVLVRDLGSANGTTLTLPGGVVQQLRAHEDYPLEPGSVVTLADVVSFTFEIPRTAS